MEIQTDQGQQSQENTHGKWFNSPLYHYEVVLPEVEELIPRFERRNFSLEQPDGIKTRLNERLDIIVRQPFEKDQAFIPVGVVSKDYALVQHSEVVDAATKALSDIDISPATVKAEFSITEYGERMRLSLYLPERFSFDPGDGHPMAMRLECLNSVEGSTRFRALLGWFRFVCSNGLVIGVTKTDLRQRHVGNLSIEDIGHVLVDGLSDAEQEKKAFENWRNYDITLDTLTPWIDRGIRKEWGFKAATRTFHIARTGHDVKIAGSYKEEKPTTIQVRKTTKVPGSPAIAKNAFDVSQILAWLAKERNDLQEQFNWRQQIPGLIKSLLN